MNAKKYKIIEVNEIDENKLKEHKNKLGLAYEVAALFLSSALLLGDGIYHLSYLELLFSGVYSALAIRGLIEYKNRENRNNNEDIVNTNEQKSERKM